MAKVNYGTIVNDARGKVNGTVFSKNKSGAYVRRKVTPANPNTGRQSAARSYLAQLSQGWSGTLNAAERAAWISYAQTYPRLDVFGNAVTLSGMNMFVSLNAVLLNSGLTIITTPPASNALSPIPIDGAGLTLVAPHTITFNETAAGSPTTTLFYIFAAKYLPAGRAVQKSDWRFLNTYVQGTVVFPATIDVGMDYVAKFGAMGSGQNVSLLIATMDPASGLTTVGVIQSGITP
jgi:hypothetical protein